MSDFQKIEIYFDEAKYEQELSEFEGKIEYFQEVVDNLKSVVPNLEFSEGDLVPLFTQPKLFLVDKLVTEPMTLGGNELDKNKVFDLLGCSEELKTIIQRIDFLNSNESYLSNEKRLNAYAKEFLISENGSVVTSQTFKDYLRNGHKIYIKNQKLKDIFDCMTKMKTAYEDLKQTNAGGFITFEKLISDCFVVNSSGEFLGLNYSFFTRGRAINQ